MAGMDNTFKRECERIEIVEAARTSSDPHLQLLAREITGIGLPPCPGRAALKESENED